jgi:hypothetical protein
MPMPAAEKSKLAAKCSPADIALLEAKVAACPDPSAVNWTQLVTDVLAELATPSIAGLLKIIADLGL